jgi:hypothetical protein
MRRATLALAAVLAADPLAAEEGKSGYSLFDPTPRDQMREMSTDRPDQTESAYTVDAGHFQLELDVVSATFDEEFGVSSEGWSLFPVNLKVGLRNNVDLQLMLDPYVRVRVEDDGTGAEQEFSGFGDVTTRVKINFWGNDGGATALAIMPFVKWPLSESEVRNGELEGGIIVPFAWGFAERWGLGAMTEVDFLADVDGDGYYAAWVNSVTTGYDLTGSLAMYLELFAQVASGFPSRIQADLGWTLGIGDDMQLDWGCNFGLSDSAPDFNPFVGFSARF